MKIKNLPPQKPKHRVTGSIKRCENTVIEAIVNPKHASGPWTLETNEAGHIIRPTNDSYDQVASVLTSTANARLIAAAPELLEALEAIIESKVLIGKTHVDLATQIIRLICKARGEGGMK